MFSTFGLFMFVCLFTQVFLEQGRKLLSAAPWAEAMAPASSKAPKLVLNFWLKCTFPGVEPWSGLCPWSAVFLPQLSCFISARAAAFPAEGRSIHELSRCTWKSVDHDQSLDKCKLKAQWESESGYRPYILHKNILKMDFWLKWSNTKLSNS